MAAMSASPAPSNDAEGVHGASAVSARPHASHNGPPADYQFSATTAEILNRIKNGSTPTGAGHTAGTPAFEAKRAEVLQSYVTSDNLPPPAPLANPGRKRGRPSKAGTPSTLRTETGASESAKSTSPVPPAGRGPARGRGRPRGRGGARGGKRKRSESADSDSDSNASESYMPQPTRTKSGRNINRPVAFVPTIPEPAHGSRRRKSAKVTTFAALCNRCQRDAESPNNRLVFCDVCNAGYHQFCHIPTIDNDVVEVLEKEWLCAPCQRSRQDVVQGTEDLVPGTGLSIDETRAYLSTLPQSKLVNILLHAKVRYPELPIFPPNIHDLVPERSSRPMATISKPVPQPPSTSISTPAVVPQKGMGSAANTPRSQHHGAGTDGSEMDPAEAQLLGEIRRYSQPGLASSNAHYHTNEYNDADGEYDTDPPALYPQPGHGLASTLPPESVHDERLVDPNHEVFSHKWRDDDAGTRPNGLGKAVAPAVSQGDTTSSTR